MKFDARLCLIFFDGCVVASSTGPWMEGGGFEGGSSTRGWMGGGLVGRSPAGEWMGGGLVGRSPTGNPGKRQPSTT